MMSDLWFEIRINSDQLPRNVSCGDQVNFTKLDCPADYNITAYWRSILDNNSECLMGTDTNVMLRCTNTGRWQYSIIVIIILVKIIIQ